MKKRLALGLAAAVVLAGCGGSSEEEQASDAVRGLLTALADGDGSQACSLMTGDFQRRILEWPDLSGKTCVEAASAAIVVGPDERDRIDARARVEVTGDNATVLLEGWGRDVDIANVSEAGNPWHWDGNFELSQVDGDWLVSDATMALESQAKEANDCLEETDEDDIEARMECFELLHSE